MMESPSLSLSLALALSIALCICGVCVCVIGAHRNPRLWKSLLPPTQSIRLQLENQSLHSQILVLTQTLAQLQGELVHRSGELQVARAEAQTQRSRAAVAMAAALGAERCDIYTDIDGVYTTDPRITSDARRLDRISYEEMLEMASLGAKVLQTRSVELAMAYNVKLRVLSSFADPEEARKGTLQPCTVICNEDEIVERHIVSGVTHSHSEAKISLMTVPDEPGRAARIFNELAAADINIDMIVQSPAKTGKAANISFSLDETDLARAQELLASLKDEIGYTDVVADKNVAKVSVIGVGMKSHAGVAATMFQTLAERSINILNISTSEIKISVLVHSEYTELAIRALHQAYGLHEIAEAS